MLPHLLALSLITDQLLEQMTVEEKVGQLLMCHFTGETANEASKILLEQAHVGGIIYYNFSNGLTSPSQVQQLSIGLQQGAKIPLLIAADQETGIIARLRSGFTLFPGNRSVAMAGDVKLAREVARATAEEMKAVGVNMNLAPVVDVNSNPKNPVIGVRAFGSDAAVVTKFSVATMQGYDDEQVISCPKHFPGHGNTTVDSHANIPVITASLEEFEKVDLQPYYALAGDMPTLMTAHIRADSIDPDHVSTLSKKTLQGLLRDKIGFKGVIVSDSLVMQGVLQECPSVEEATVRAFEAGCDILLLGGRQLIGSEKKELTPEQIVQVHKTLVTAVKTGRISKDRLDASTRRILQLKEKYGLFKTIPLTADNIAQHIKTPAHEALAQKIAELSVRTLHNHLPPKFSLAGRKTLTIALQALQPEIDWQGEKSFFKEFNPSEKEITDFLAQAKDVDTVILLSFNAWKFAAQQKLFTALKEMGKTVIVFCTRDPEDAPFFKEADALIATYGPAKTSLDAAHKLL